MLFNRVATYRPCWLLFRGVSRLSDGVFWYALMIALALANSDDGLRCALHMAAAGVLGLLVYRLIKLSTSRPRPFTTLDGIQPGSRPLDEFSFPSGHTLHAVGFTVVLHAYYPVLALALVPFVVLVALSRLVLGLHYPSDVLAGCLMGAAVALLALLIAL